MKRRLALAALLATAALTAASAEAQQVRTKSYVYEWIHLRPSALDGSLPVLGALFLEDISGHGSRLDIHLTDPTTGEPIFECTAVAPERNFAPPEPFRHDYDIIQVGPFAQQATGDISANGFDTFLEFQCGQTLTSLTLNCPYQGVPVSRSLSHISFTHSGTSGAPQGIPATSFTQKGHHSPIQCNVVIDGVTYRHGRHPDPLYGDAGGALWHYRPRGGAPDVARPLARRL